MAAGPGLHVPPPGPCSIQRPARMTITPPSATFDNAKPADTRPGFVLQPAFAPSGRSSTVWLEVFVGCINLYSNTQPPERRRTKRHMEHSRGGTGGCVGLADHGCRAGCGSSPLRRGSGQRGSGRKPDCFHLSSPKQSKYRKPRMSTLYYDKPTVARWVARG